MFLHVADIVYFTVSMEMEGVRLCRISMVNIC